MPPSWSELAALFVRLEPRLAAARLDYSEQEGAVRWTLVSGPKDPAPLELVTLARIAGEQLAPVTRFLHDSIRAEADPCARWYLALRHHSGQAVGFGERQVRQAEPHVLLVLRVDVAGVACLARAANALVG